MATMKRNIIMFMLMVAAILFCSLQQVVVAREVVVDIGVVDDGNGLGPYPWEWPCYLPWPFPFPRPWPCPPPPPKPKPCPPPPPPPCPPPPSPPTSCSASDKAKVYKCMYNTTSIDVCCPTFRSILGTSCPCYEYADDLDNQLVITLSAYCDVTSPCKSVQVIELPKVEKK